MNLINKFIRFFILSIGFSFVGLPVHGQIEVYQNNNVDLRSGEAIITDNEINFRSGGFKLNDNLAQIKPKKNMGILFIQDQTTYSMPPLSFTHKRPAIVPKKTGLLGGVMGSNGSIGTKNERWSDVYTWDLYANRILSISDSNFKKDVNPVSGGLDKVMNLNPVKYRFNAQYYNRFSPDTVGVNPDSIPNQVQLGFIAQEVNQVLPNAVKYEENKETGTGSYLLSQEDVVPVLTDAIQRQQQMIEDLQNQVDSLQNDIQGCCE